MISGVHRKKNSTFVKEKKPHLISWNRIISHCVQTGLSRTIAFKFINILQLVHPHFEKKNLLLFFCRETLIIFIRKRLKSNNFKTL